MRLRLLILTNGRIRSNLSLIAPQKNPDRHEEIRPAWSPITTAVIIQRPPCILPTRKPRHELLPLNVINAELTSLLHISGHRISTFQSGDPPSTFSGTHRPMGHSCMINRGPGFLRVILQVVLCCPPVFPPFPEFSAPLSVICRSSDCVSQQGLGTQDSFRWVYASGKLTFWGSI
ncbi:hypothetical protein PAMP_014386 [Pampus punctatissimus]